jgi:regulatory protein
MKITAIEQQKKRGSRVSVFVDGEFAFGCSLDALAEIGLKKGQPVSPSQIEQWRRKIIYDEAKTVAFNALARRIRSEREIRDKLRKKKFPLDIIDQVVARLYEMKLLNDSEFAGALVRDRLKRAPIGKAALKTKLFQKGVAKETIETALNEVDLRADELCLKAAEKKLKSLQREPDAQKRKQKLSQFLMRRGFDWETVNNAVRKTL